MMKKILYIILVALVLGSCTEIIPLGRGPLEDCLDMLALMHSSDDEHVVYLRLSNDNGLTSADEDAVITCTINGGEKIEAEHKFMMGIPGKFGFEAKFRPGDEVLLEAEYRGLYACSKVVVPQPVGMELLDTTMIMKYIEDGDNDETRVTYLIDFLLKDIPGENNCFRVGASRHHIRHIFHQWPDESGNPRPSETRDHWRVSGNIDIGRDPILHDDYMVSNGDDLISMINPTNYYMIFSDRLFTDEEAEIQVSFEGYRLETFYGGYLNLPEHLKETEVISTQHLVIEHISEETYRYYKALNSARIFSYESYGGLLMEPVIIPSNVQGGTGFVSISMDSTVPVPIHHSMMEGFDGNTMVPIKEEQK